MTQPHPTNGPGVAFFDLDETLVSFKSMASFLAFYGRRDAGMPTWEEFVAQLDPERDRTRANTTYYELWKGTRRTDVLAAGRDWFAEIERARDTWIPETLERLQRHRDASHAVVLVTGSFAPVTTPIAQALDVDHVLDSQLEVVDGHYTGRLLRRMIGDAKATAVRRHLATCDLATENVWAYGDHESDLPMLELAGHRSLVRPAPSLAARAREKGIEVLAPGPADGTGDGGEGVR